MRNKKVTRFIVFRALKNYMDRHHRCPTSHELASITGLSDFACRVHMKALDGAAGIPYSTVRARTTDRSSGWFEWKGERANLDPWRAPVDRLMA